MKKSIIIFTMFFIVQLDASDREITCTTKGPKGKDPLPEKTPLLINEVNPMLKNKEKFDLGAVRTNLKLSDISELDEDSRIKMFALQKSLFEDPKDQKCCCGYLRSPSLCKSDHERNYEIVLGSDYKNLLAIADKQGWVVNERRWTVNTEGIIVRHKGDTRNNHDYSYYAEDRCGKCLMYSSLVPICGGFLFLLGWGFCPKLIPCTLSKPMALTIIGSLEGGGGGGLALGGIYHECNISGQDYERLQKLYAIMKTKK